MKTAYTILALTLLGIGILGSGTDHGSRREFSQQLKLARK